jgi:hypothetical protein
MSVIVDDANLLRTPVPTGPERIEFPYPEDLNVTIVSQDFVQLGSYYRPPTGSLINVGTYQPRGQFLDQAGFEPIGGGAVRYTLRFITNHTQYKQEKEVYESVSFPGWRQRQLPYTEKLDLYYEIRTYVVKTQTTYSNVGREIIMREPFSQTVKCIETKTIVSASSQGTFSTPRYREGQNVYINGQYYRVGAGGSTVTRGGVTLSVNDPAILRGNQPEVFYEDGNNNIEANMEKFKEENRTTTELFKSRLPFRFNALPDELKNLYLPTRVISKEMNFTRPTAGGKRPVTNMLSETSSPTVAEYADRIGKASMIVKPTEFEEIAGSFMFKTDTVTQWL